MSKQILNQRYIYKIRSSYINRCKGDVKLNNKDIIKNVKNRYIVGYGDSNATRMLREISNSPYDEEYINNIKEEIENLIDSIKHTDNKDELKEIKKQIKNKTKEKYIASLESNICNVVFDEDEDYDKYSKEGFKINGNKYVLLIGTTGGVKSNSVLFVCEKWFDELWEDIKCGADFSTPIIPSKLMAYMALTFSQSTPVTNPKKILVVKDVETIIHEDVNYISFDKDKKQPKLELINNFEIKINACDGCGMITPSLANQWVKDLQEDYPISAFCVRYAWVKGMLTRFDFRTYCKEVLNTTVVKDVWGQEHNIDDVEIILNESMLKYWKAYNSLDEYISKCNEHKYHFAVTKYTPNHLENERTLNYQYIQCLNLTDEDIDNLLKDDIQEIKDVLGMDYRKTILFSKGKGLNDDNVWNKDGFLDDLHARALMVNPNTISDSYIRDRVKNAISKRIDMLKIGKVKVNGNYQIAVGEPIIQLESMCGFEPKGLLGAGEFYIEYWRQKDVKKVGAFRSPMSCKENARIMNVCNKEKAIKWYGHLNGLIIFNGWDTTAMAENGQDFDGDLNFTTNNKIIVNGIYDLPAICCEEQSADKKKNVSRNDLIKCIKSSFGNKVGIVTNIGSSCYDTLSKFEEGTPEYNEIDYRIKCSQYYQQAVIDAVKTGKSPKLMPSYWHKSNSKQLTSDNSKLSMEEREFYSRIVSDKKPYYFIYIYNKMKKEYDNFMKSTNISCARRFKCKIEDLLIKEDRTEDEENFVQWYYKMNPVAENPCIINKTAWKVEKEFENYKLGVPEMEFDYNIYKLPSCEDLICTSAEKRIIKDAYTDYKKNKNNQYMHTDYNNKEDGVKTNGELLEALKDDIRYQIPDEQKLLNTLLEMGYEKSVITKNMVWIIAGDIIIKNLLKNNDNKIYYPTKDKNGDILYDGNKFKMIEKEIDKYDI